MDTNLSRLAWCTRLLQASYKKKNKLNFFYSDTKRNIKKGIILSSINQKTHYFSELLRLLFSLHSWEGQSINQSIVLSFLSLGIIHASIATKFSSKGCLVKSAEFVAIR